MGDEISIFNSQYFRFPCDPQGILKQVGEVPEVGKTPFHPDDLSSSRIVVLIPIMGWRVLSNYADVALLR